MKLSWRDAGVLLLWILLAPMLLFVCLRAIGFEEDHARFFALVTFTPVLLLPAWVVLVASAVLRQWLLTSFAVMVVLAQVAWVAPDLKWWPESQPRAAGREITLVAANVLKHNGEMSRAADALRRLDADVLVLEELTPAMASLIRGAYPAAAEDAREGAFGSAIYSRFPLSDVRRFELDGYPALRADVSLQDGAVTVIAVHTLQPLAGLGVLRRQLRQLDELATSIRAEGKPVVLAGDFNATRQHKDFRNLLQHGLRDAHIELGRGWSRTWPTDRWLPPFALLDHILVSDGIVVRDVGTATIPGSDHRAVTATLARSSS